MNHNQILTDTYRQAAGVVRMHLGDFTDADMLVRPVENSNHAAWHVGHLVVGTAMMINMVTPGAMPDFPADYVERHGTKGSKVKDGFESKERLLERFDQITDAAVAWLGKLTDADMDKPTPQALQGFASTVGHLAHMHVPHVNMHLGQIQVIRRKLGKPVLF
jgi:hypothetical protein